MSPTSGHTPPKLCDWYGEGRCLRQADAELTYADGHTRWVCRRHAGALLNWYQATHSTAPLPMLRLVNVAKEDQQG